MQWQLFPIWTIYTPLISVSAAPVYKSMQWKQSGGKFSHWYWNLLFASCLPRLLSDPPLKCSPQYQKRQKAAVRRSICSLQGDRVAASYGNSGTKHLFWGSWWFLFNRKIHHFHPTVISRPTGATALVFLLCRFDKNFNFNRVQPHLDPNWTNPIWTNVI